MHRRQQLGKWGEQLAAAYLEAKGWVIVQHNWRCRYGEIDLIARHGDTLVFVEVRTRSSARYGSPEESVNRRKQQKLRQLALLYLTTAEAHYSSYRFDVVTLFCPDMTGEPLVNHYSHAF